MMRLILSLTLLFPPLVLNTFYGEQKYDDILEKGIIFNEETKILLAEKFVPVQFLIPFPSFNFSMKSDIEKLLHNLNQKWNLESSNCPLDFTSHFNTNSSHNINWIMHQLEIEVEKSRAEVEKMRNETATFLQTESEKSNRIRRGAHVGALAMAGIGLFGSGIMMGSSGGCGVTGIFGSCQDQAKANAHNIEQLTIFTEAITEYVTHIKEETNDKFFMVSNELAEIREIQKQMSETQNKNWAVVEEQFDILETNVHILRNCDQMLYSNQQINFNFDTAAALLTLLYSDVKSYRAALYSYRLNLLNSIPTLLQKHLPMSLVPRDSLMAILDNVGREQYKAADRLSLAIPTSDLMSYYDAKLLRDVITVEEGLIVTLAIPLASRQTVFSVYSAETVPMPQPEPQMAIKWSIEAPYLAISEDQMESIPLSASQFEQCLGSSRYRICHQAVATQPSHGSCLATLFFKTTIEAIRECETEVIFLPNQVQARNLGYGIWLITSATENYSLRKTSIDTAVPTQSQIVPGCKICIVTIECGYQLLGHMIKIRADLSSCDRIPAKRVRVKLADPLEFLLSELPPIDSLPYFETTTTAGVNLLRKVREKMLLNPVVTKSEHLSNIAKPIAHEMTMFKPSLMKEFSSYVPIKLSLSLTVIVFILNLILHALFLWLYHRFRIIRQLVPSFLKHDDNTKIGVKPVICVKDQFKDEINPKWKQKFHILSEQIQSIRSSRASNLNLNANNIDPNVIASSMAKSRQSLASSPSTNHISTADIGAEEL